MNPRVLGFDFGKRKIGVATGNLITCTAQPLAAITPGGNHPPWQKIDAVVAEWRPGLLVIGLPLDGDGEDTPMSRQARKFARALLDQTGIPVELVDERYTSAAADSLLRESAIAGKGHAKQISRNRDGVAAELILQTYFNDNPAATGSTAETT